MPLTIGKRLGPYEIVSLLGEGGMGQVYRARDAKLNRDVALKILPDAFATDPDRLARFQREAQVLASLNHPNIGHIYGFEDRGSEHALVLELVEGPTLADRIAQGPMAPADALPIAKQIADALEAAHEQGVVHRDLKPANIKVRDDGTVKVLDFGLAKALEPPTAIGAEALNSPTRLRQGYSEAGVTEFGVILGTAAYMAPEQAKGKAVDRRADIWAFGAVFYEMLSGQRAFKGEDISDTLASVLRQDVDWSALPESTPAPVRRLIVRCLDRDIRRRLRDIGEARIALEDPGASGSGDLRSGGSGGATSAPALPLSFWRRAMPVVLAAIVTGALAGTAGWYFRPPTPLAVTRLPFNLPDGQAFTGTGRRMIALSPDGTQIVYGANGRLYHRSMAELDVKAIPGTEIFQNVHGPVFSPDGRSIAFYSVGDQTLRRIAITGGAAVTICAADGLFGSSWEPDGILFGQSGKGILRVSPNGGTPEVLVSLKDGEVAHGPQMLPGGRHVLFTLTTATGPNRWERAQIVVQSLASGERKVLIDGGSDARYVPTGHLAYALGGIVFAVAFDVQRLEVKGVPVPMIEGVRRAQPAGTTGAANFSFSDTGSLIYVPGGVSPSSTQNAFVLTDRNGNAKPLKLPPGPYVAPRVSRDGTRIAFGSDDGKEAIVSIYELSGTTGVRRLTFGGNNRFPVWSSDGRRIAFQSDRDGDFAIFWQAADGTGSAERLTTPEQGTSHLPESWSPKGDQLLFNVTKGSDVSLWMLSVADRKATPFDGVHSSIPSGADFSPDGRWVAYAITEQGSARIQVQPFPPTGSKFQLSGRGSDTSQHPRWSTDGRELFYNPGPGGFATVSVTTQPTFAFGNPVRVPRPFLTGPPESRRGFDVTPDGKFVGLITGQTESGAPAAPQIQVVLNWFEELKQRVPSGK